MSDWSAAGAGGGLATSAGGILLALATTFSFAVYWVAIVPVMERHSLVVSANSCLIGGSLLGVAAIPWLVGEHWAGQPGSNL